MDFGQPSSRIGRLNKLDLAKTGDMSNISQGSTKQNRVLVSTVCVCCGTQHVATASAMTMPEWQ